MYNKIKTISIMLTCFSISMAGTGAAVGTASGTQLLIPTGAKGIALNSTYNASVQGVDALYYNPAGIAGNANGVEAQFSSQTYIADINQNYAAFVSNVGNGTIGLAFNTLDFGSIKKTDAIDTHGNSGKTYSPNFSVLSLSYAKSFSDRIRFGSTLKVINETIEQTGGMALALDMGVQYSHASMPLKLGVSLRNLGSKMEYTGVNLETDNTSILTQAANIPANLNISTSYQFGPLDLHYAFTNNSYSFNESAFGAEYKVDLVGFDAWVGAGMNLLLVEEDDLDEMYTKNPFGASFGAGISTKLGNFNFGLDFGMRQSEEFGNTSVLAFNVGF